MRTYKNLYSKLCSLENLELAFKKAKKDKTHLPYVIQFEENLDKELMGLHKELISFAYKPNQPKRFIIRDPKTRKIHASAFRDRIIHHAIINILEPIFDKTFIYDSYANRKNKGAHKAIQRFDYFKRKVSKNGALSRNPHSNNNIVCYALKADIKHYFDTVDHEILLAIIKKKIKDERVIWLVKQILSNFDVPIKGKGMPLGNLTSQFFANIYLNDLDYFVKHKLKIKYYIRYVDDFIILHENKNFLEVCKEKICKYLKNLRLELHPDKSKILPLRNGLAFLGYRIFYYYKLLRKSNILKFERNFKKKLYLYKCGLLSYENIVKSLQGWFGYAGWADTYKIRKLMLQKINQ